MDLKEKLFWYLIHIERTVRKSNSISADVIEDRTPLKTIRTMSVSDLFSKIWQFIFYFDTLQDKSIIMHTLFVKIIFICNLCKTGQDHVHILFI